MDPRTHARRTDPDTSRLAAHQLTDKSTMLTRLLTTYLDTDRTADEAARAAGYGPSDGAWKRVSDLAQLGYLIETGARRKGNAGRLQLVRRITDEGVIALARKAIR